MFHEKEKNANETKKFMHILYRQDFIQILL